MKSVTAHDIEQELKFAREAAKDFADHPEHWSYGTTEPGSLLALRWGMGNDCVLVLKLDESFTPTNYQMLVNSYLPTNVDRMRP